MSIADGGPASLPADATRTQIGSLTPEELTAALRVLSAWSQGNAVTLTAPARAALARVNDLFGPRGSGVEDRGVIERNNSTSWTVDGRAYDLTVGYVDFKGRVWHWVGASSGTGTPVLATANGSAAATLPKLVRKIGIWHAEDQEPPMTFQVKGTTYSLLLRYTDASGDPWQYVGRWGKEWNGRELRPLWGRTHELRLAGPVYLLTMQEIIGCHGQVKPTDETTEEPPALPLPLPKTKKDKNRA